MKVEHQLTIMVTLRNKKIYIFFLGEQVLPVWWRNLHESRKQPQNLYI